MTGTDKPQCTVCISNYNGADVIGPCIESVYNQDADSPIEIMVYDDASQDGSVELIRNKYPGVVLIAGKENAGFCAVNNRMALQAKGEYLLLLNNDAVLHRDALRTLYESAQKSTVPAILSLPQYHIETGRLIDMGERLDMFMNPVPNKDPEKQNVAMVIGACLWIPRSLWDELGGFPEWFGNLAEDMYICCLARLKGYSVQSLPASGYDHWVGKSFGGGKLVQNSMQTTFRRRALSEKNKSFVMIVYYPALPLYLIFPLHALLLLLEGILLSIIKKDMHILTKIYLPALTSIGKERNRLARLRRSIQRDRKITIRELLAVHTVIPYKLSMLLKHGMPVIE